MTTDTLPSGDDLRQEREAAGLTQVELAVLIGSYQSYVSVIEGKARPSKDAVNRFRAAIAASKPKDAA